MFAGLAALSNSDYAPSAVRDLQVACILKHAGPLGFFLTGPRSDRGFRSRYCCLRTPVPWLLSFMAIALSRGWPVLNFVTSPRPPSLCPVSAKHYDPGKHAGVRTLEVYIPIFELVLFPFLRCNLSAFEVCLKMDDVIPKFPFCPSVLSAAAIVVLPRP